jgi:hypothetical protein
VMVELALGELSTSRHERFQQAELLTLQFLPPPRVRVCVCERERKRAKREDLFVLLVCELHGRHESMEDSEASPREQQSEQRPLGEDLKGLR